MSSLSATASAAATATAPATFSPLLQSTCAVMNLVACCGIGISASKARILDQTAVSALSRLVYNVFQPSLLFTNVVQTLSTPNQAKSTLLILPAAAMIQILTASVLSALVMRLMRMDPRSEQGRETRICSTFANSGPLPLLFVDALFKNHPNPTLRPRAVAYISFYLLAWSPLFWTYGHGILVDDKANTLLKKDPIVENTCNGRSRGKDRLRGRLHHFTSSPLFTRIVNPPTLGCTMGALMGSIPYLRSLFLGKNPPLGSIFDALRTMGSAYVPCVLLVLAGSLANGLEGFDGGLLRRAAAVMIQRFVLMPLLVLGLVTLGIKGGYIPTTDSLLIFILLLQGCMPSAQNSVLILQLEKRPQAAASMARLISTIYVLSIIPIGLLLQGLLSLYPVS